jgi:hypothetical protein
VLNDVLCDSLQYYHALAANRRQIVFWRTLYVSQWYLMSIAFDLFCLMVSFKMPNAAELSVRSVVGGGMWPNSVSVTMSGAPLWAFWKHALTSDSAAEATTFFITDATLSLETFRVSSCGVLSPQKYIPRWLRTFKSERYDASLWMYIVMYDA